MVTKKKAGPKLLAPQLRRLPSELVTNDVDDEAKVHELDAPHVLKGLVKDYGKKVTEPDKTRPKLFAPGPGERAAVTQWFVDVAKMRVLSALVNRAVDDHNAGRPVDLGVKHLWFPENNVNHYHLRKGNPPPNRRRPKHMREIDLVIDICEPPRSVIKLLREQGISLDVHAALKQANESGRLVSLA